MYFSPSDYKLLQFVLQQQREQQLKAAAAAAAAGRPAKDLQQLKRETAEQQERLLQKLKACLSYCRLVDCRRKYLLQQFGEAYNAAATGTSQQPIVPAAAAAGAVRCCDNCSNPAAALRRSVLLSKMEATVAAAPSVRHGSWEDTADAPLATLEIERQEYPDADGASPWRGPCGGARRRGGAHSEWGRQGGGRVVYKNPTATPRQSIPESVRKKGLSAVMQELERREQQHESRCSNSSNNSCSKKHHALFAEFRSASRASKDTSLSTSSTKTNLPAAATTAPAVKRPLKTLGLCRPLGLQRSRPSP